MKQIRDQILHVLIFGILALLHPALGAAAVSIYELADWHVDVGPVTIGQWPPGKPTRVFEADFYRWSLDTQMDRVEDLRWDLVFELAGVGVGSIAHAALVWWLL